MRLIMNARHDRVRGPRGDRAAWKKKSTNQKNSFLNFEINTSAVPSTVIYNLLLPTPACCLLLIVVLHRAGSPLGLPLASIFVCFSLCAAPASVASRVVCGPSSLFALICSVCVALLAAAEAGSAGAWLEIRRSLQPLQCGSSSMSRRYASRWMRCLTRIAGVVFGCVCSHSSSH